MKIIERAIQVVACGVCALAISPSAVAEAQRGFYLGVSAGKSSEEFDGVVVDSFAAAGAPVITGSSTFEDSDTAMTLFAGYRFLPYIAVEASYIDLGVAEYRFSGTVNPPGPATSAPTSFSMDIETKGFSVAGIGSLPLGTVVDLHGRVGLLVARTDISATARIDSSRTSDTDSIDSVSAFLGVGAGFHLGHHWSLSLDWVRYLNVGDDNEDDDFDTEEGFDIDALSFGVAYRF